MTCIPSAVRGFDPSSFPFRALLDVDAEGTIPVWYTSAQLLVTGLLFACAGERVPRSAAVAPWFFWLVGLGFVFLRWMKWRASDAGS